MSASRLSMIGRRASGSDVDVAPSSYTPRFLPSHLLPYGGSVERFFVLLRVSTRQQEVELTRFG